MRIAITGASGFVGARLSQALRAAGHEVLPVSRSAGAGGVRWDPAAGTIDAAALEGVDAVVHLAGENVAGYWTAARKRRIMESRVQGTGLLSRTLARLQRPPAVLVSASAVGFYGAHAPDEPLDETASAGGSFLAQVAQAWEQSTQAAETAGIRVVHARFGIVLGRGGVIGVMMPLFQVGLGGPIGGGRQMIPWIALDEVPPVVLHVLGDERLRGPVNFVSPEPTSFGELASALAGVLHRPALFPLPAWAARLALGQMGEELVLTGARVLPRRLLETGYRFRFPELRGALEHALAPAA